VGLETLEVVGDGAGGAWVDEVLFGSKNCAALWLVLVEVGVVEVAGAVEGDDELEDVTSGSTNPGVTQTVSVYPTISVSVTQSVTITSVVRTSRL
jgi:hypothetical protein